MPKTVMIVDDEKDIRDSVESILKKNGYNVVTAKDGDDCLSKIKQAKPSLILLDIMMPGTPVRDIVKKIPKRKIAFLTVVQMSDAERSEIEKAKNIVDFIQKPFDLKDLLKRVKKIIG